VPRVKPSCIANIYYRRHSGLRLAQRHQLRFAQLSPVALIRLGFVRVPVRKLHKIERKIAAPRTSPIADHRWKKSSVLISASGVALALVPDDAANGERNERRDLRVVKHARIVLVTGSDSVRA